MGEKLIHNDREPLAQLSNRNVEFYKFTRIVRAHIDNYTVPQYGDAPDDEVEGWTAEMCVAAIQKYTKRFGSARRGRLEELRDLVKIAHFAAIAFWKILPSEEEIEKIERGKI